MFLEDKLQNVKSVAIGGHVRPDGDCVGSTMAVYNYITKYFPAIEVDVYLEQIPTIFNFMQGTDQIKAPGAKAKVYDLFIVLDCGDEGRLGDSADNFRNAKDSICIDHHVSNQSFAKDNYIVPDASSTCELVYNTLDETRINKEIAECLYTGMVHDTGVFQYSCTSRSTMEIAGKLMECGINYSEIIDQTFYEKLYKQNKILGQALLNSRLYEDAKCIASVITQKEMQTYDVLPRHLEGIVSQLRVTKECEVAIFLYELEDGAYKASTRCKGDEVDLSILARKYGGGGHKKAAGFSLQGEDPWTLVEEVVAEVKAQLA